MNFNFKLKIAHEAQCNMGSDIGEMSWTGEPTVQDLIDYALGVNNGGEWGYVYIGPNYLSPIRVKFSSGKLLTEPDETFSKFLDKHIESITWYGGWSRSDYCVVVKEARNDKPSVC